MTILDVYFLLECFILELNIATSLMESWNGESSMSNKRFLAELKLYEKMQHHERLAHAQGYHILAGIDEAGRGPLAGPVVAAACVLDPNAPIYGLNDSKKLTPAKRGRLFKELLDHAQDYAIAQAEHDIIDEINILEATRLAMKSATDSLKIKPDLLLTDAVELHDVSCPVWSIVKGDGHSVSIAAASILAKVTRDELMEQYDQQYPGYGFAQHKGYGTPAHYKALLELGPTPIHRRTFLRNIADQLIQAGHVKLDYFTYN